MIISKNASRADNQQERLMMIGWIIGFVDGEGCFSINFVKQTDKQEKSRIRKGYKIGLQITHRFAVVQSEKSIDVLKELHKFFGVGDLYVNRRHDNHKENLFRYSVSKREDLMKVIIPFFQKNPLKTSKQNDFNLFVKCVELMDKKEHLTKKGAIKIAQLCEKMNQQKPKTDIIRILRDHTPKPLSKG